MRQIFPKNFDRNLIIAILAVGPIVTALPLFAWYYMSPRFIEAGYRPEQPIDYSHRLHAGELGLDCRYCHSSVEVSAKATVPSTQTCMNCHSMIGKDNEKLSLLRQSWSSGKPIKWVRVHDLPDYVQFNHGVHVRANIGCQSCHGDVRAMEVVGKVEPHSMRWCLECHRNPAPHIRPFSEITNTDWKPGDDQENFAAEIIKQKKLKAPEDCSSCHY